MAEFEGFPAEGLDFYTGLEADNSGTYWVEHRQAYDDAVRTPMLALCERLGPEFGAAKVFDPFRDVRFGSDRAPYKTHQGAVLGDLDGAGWRYVQVSASGLLAASGAWYLSTDQLARYRAAVADDRRGSALQRAIETVRAAGHQVAGDLLATRPPGVPEDHPRVELLRHISLTASHDFGRPDWLHTARAADVVAGTWREMSPLTDWLRENVGPSEQPGG